MPSRHVFRRFVAVAALALPTAMAPAGLAPAVAASEAARLSPHRAVYEMSLGEVRSGAGVSGISGRMVYEFTGAPCAGYTLNMRLVTQFSDRSGQGTLTDLRSSTWEHADGRQFRFNSSQYLDETATESTAGEVSRGVRGVRLKLSQPSRSERALPTDVLFPTQHSFAVLGAAQAGRTMVRATVFDGSEKGEKLYDTTAFIGRTIPPGESPVGDLAEAEVLNALPSWPISISYFERGAAGDAAPAYELNFRLFANGVSTDLRIDYGDFVLRGVLRGLDLLAPPACP